MSGARRTAIVTQPTRTTEAEAQAMSRRFNGTSSSSGQGKLHGNGPLANPVLRRLDEDRKSVV